MSETFGKDEVFDYISSLPEGLERDRTVSEIALKIAESLRLAGSGIEQQIKQAEKLGEQYTTKEPQVKLSREELRRLCVRYGEKVLLASYIMNKLTRYSQTDFKRRYDWKVVDDEGLLSLNKTIVLLDKIPWLLGKRSKSRALLEKLAQDLLEPDDDKLAEND